MNHIFIAPAFAHEGEVHTESSTAPEPEVQYVSFSPTATVVTYILLGLIVIVGVLGLIFTYNQRGKQ
ncbi:MAG TPA: hypothetical protein VGE59_04560 [Patescibacteria group bacterium]